MSTEPGRTGATEPQPTHPRLAAALLMVGVLALIVALSVVSL